MAIGGRSLAIAATVVVVATVIGAVFATGGPSEQREIRLDEQRARDLDLIVTAVNAHWVRHKALPLSLDSMVPDQLARVPRDPVTHQPYSYTTTGPKNFRVCATFQRPTEEDDDGGVTRVYGKSWGHHARGQACYDLEPYRQP